jgi:glycosyltransferase involved in cell wall biosynthesis
MVQIDHSMKKASVVELMQSLNMPVGFTEHKDGPFLTVLTRTQGRRPHMLKEVMLCLMAQECDDFEWIIAAHKTGAETIEAIQKMIKQSPDSFRSKVRILDVQDGTRARPVNAGLENARGRYFAVLDDDDAVLAHWVKEFKAMAESESGKVLRTMPLWQDYTITGGSSPDRHTARSAAPPVTGPERFHFLNNFFDNENLFHCLAFPTAAFHQWGIRLDESLNTLEDWDFILHMAGVCGVYCSSVPTAVYRCFDNHHNSRTEHDWKEWKRCNDSVRENINGRHFVLPPGSIWSAFERPAVKIKKDNLWGIVKKVFKTLRKEGLFALLYKIRRKLKGK